MSEDDTSVETQDFDLAEWCKKYGITRKTEAILSKEELTSARSLKLLDGTDIRELGIPIAQRKYLMLAVQELKAQDSAASGRGTGSTETGTGSTNSEQQSQQSDREELPPSDATENSGGQVGDTSRVVTIEDIRQQTAALGAAGKALDQLFAESADGARSSGPLSGRTKPSASPPGSSNPYVPGSHTDPRTILTVKAGASKAVHITQFLSERTKRRLQSRRRGVVLGTSEQQTVVFKPDERHPYAGITLSEWSAANCRVMAHLLQTGELAPSHVEYYLSYSTQIYEFYELYDWEAILEFDYTYRERQCQHKFPFGYIPPNMEMALLSQPRARRSQQQQQQQQQHQQHQVQQGAGVRGRPNTTRSPDVCKLYLAREGKCPFGDKCKYTHPADDPPQARQ